MMRVCTAHIIFVVHARYNSCAGTVLVILPLPPPLVGFVTVNTV